MPALAEQLLTASEADATTLHALCRSLLPLLTHQHQAPTRRPCGVAPDILTVCVCVCVRVCACVRACVRCVCRVCCVCEG
jgi:hypothetical protein